MKKYLVLYQSNVSATEQLATATQDQVKAGMEAWMSWAHDAGPAVVDIGSPVGHAHHFTSPTASTSGNGHVGGFSILQAADDEALKALLQQHPHFTSAGASLEVYEFLPLPGM